MRVELWVRAWCSVVQDDWSVCVWGGGGGVGCVCVGVCVCVYVCMCVVCAYIWVEMGKASQVKISVLIECHIDFATIIMMFRYRFILVPAKILT